MPVSIAGQQLDHEAIFMVQEHATNVLQESSSPVTVASHKEGGCLVYLLILSG